MYNNFWHWFGLFIIKPCQLCAGFFAFSLLVGSTSREDLWHFAKSFRYWFPLQHLLLCKMREATSGLPPWIDAAAAQLVICHIYLNNHPNAWGLNLAASVHLYLLPGRPWDPAASLAGLVGPRGTFPSSNSLLKPQVRKINLSISLSSILIFIAEKAMQERTSSQTALSWTRVWMKPTRASVPGQ